MKKKYEVEVEEVKEFKSQLEEDEDKGDGFDIERTRIAERMLDVAQFEYKEEFVRSQNIEARIATLFNLTWIIITIAAAFKLFESQGQLSDGLKNFDLVITVISMIVITIAVIYFLLAMLPVDYARIILDNQLNPSRFDLSHGRVTYKIACNYKEYTLVNRKLINKKVNRFTKGAIFLTIAFILVIIKYVTIYIFAV